MEAKAIAKYLRISSRKVRIVAENIKGKPVEDALNILKFTPKKSAQLISKVLYSAIANAGQIPGCDVDGCETFIYDGPAIVVAVRDAETGAQLSAGVIVTAQTDGYSEQLELVQTQPPQFEGVVVAVDRPRVRPGTYTVTVSADGYEQASASADVIADDFCFSTPIPSRAVELEIELTPLAP